MGATLIEMPLIGTLTGSDIAERGWPTCGAALENHLHAAEDRALNEWVETTGYGRRSPQGTVRNDLEARFRRLQCLHRMAGHRRHAMQCAALGFPAEGRQHFRMITPALRLEYAAWRLYGRAPSADNRKVLDLVLLVINSGLRRDSRRTSGWRQSRAGLADHPLTARIDVYLEGVARQEWW